jgi:hypothetical protein
MKFHHQSHLTTPPAQTSELGGPVGLALKGVADRMPDQTLLFHDHHSDEEYLVTEEETAASITAPSALTGPEATYVVLNALQL